VVLEERPRGGVSDAGSHAPLLHDDDDVEEPLERLMYMSLAAGGTVPAMVAAIGAASKARNASCGVTGFLVYAPPRFFQMIDKARYFCTKIPWELVFN
jgi:hypothetical protein